MWKIRGRGLAGREHEMFTPQKPDWTFIFLPVAPTMVKTGLGNSMSPPERIFTFVKYVYIYDNIYEYKFYTEKFFVPLRIH